MNNSSKQLADKLSNFRFVKGIELVLVFIVEIIYFCTLYFNTTLRHAVFTNKLLFSLCLLMWIVLILIFLYMLTDLFLLRNATADSAILSQNAYVDNLTGLPNRQGIDLTLNTPKSDEEIENMGCVLIRISNIGDLNMIYGHDVGNTVIQAFSKILKEVGNKYGFVGRNDGNEYLGIFNFCDDDVITQFIADMYVSMNEHNMAYPDMPIEIEYAYALNSIEHKNSCSDLLTIVYRALEENPLS